MSTQPNPKKYDVPSKDFYKLDQMIRAAESLGNPQFGRHCILAAGTNAKGSIANYLSALFRSIGLRVGTYSSPHVLRPTERFRINGDEISQKELEEFEQKYEVSLKSLTYFERMTLLAFLMFRDLKVDVQVIEVGMGGRLDATNICEPDISVIGPIGLDHEEVLGKGYRSIAFEKAGIMRPHRITWVYLPKNPEVKQVFEEQAKKLGSDLKISDQPLEQSSMEQSLAKDLSDRGSHQIWNARLSWRVFEEACKLWELKPKYETALFKNRQWLGRIQKLRQSPPFIVDGAHNESAAECLRDYLKEYFPKTKFLCVFGAMREKMPEKILEPIRDWISEIYLPSFFPPREIKNTELKEFLERDLKSFSGKIHLMPSLEGEIATLWDKRRPVLVLGSFYLAGEVIRALESKV